jgi:hypothetical protein
VLLVESESDSDGEGGYPSTHSGYF